jgi:Family of unknown function (DUF5317)
MSPIIVILAVAVVVGLVAGGSLRNFERVRVHWWALAFGGVALQALPAPTIAGIDPRTVGAAMLVLSYVLLLAFITVNRWVPAAGVMAVGLLLNLSVVAINGGMPVSTSAIRTAGGSTLALASASDAKHHVMTERDKLRPLADVIPIPRPAGIVLSIGDELLYIGMAWFVVQVMRGRSRENPRPLAVWFLSYRGKHAPSHWRIPARYRTAAPPASTARSGTGP